MVVSDFMKYKTDVKAFSTNILGINNYWECDTSTTAVEIIFNLIFNKRNEKVFIFQENKYFFEHLKDLLRKVPDNIQCGIFYNRIEIGSNKIEYIRKDNKTTYGSLRGYSINVLVLDAVDSEVEFENILPSLRSTNGVILEIDSRFIE